MQMMLWICKEGTFTLLEMGRAGIERGSSTCKGIKVRVALGASKSVWGWGSKIGRKTGREEPGGAVCPRYRHLCFVSEVLGSLGIILSREMD